MSSPRYGAFTRKSHEPATLIAHNCKSSELGRLVNAHPTPNPVLGDMNQRRPRRSCLDPMRTPVLRPKCSTCPSGCVPLLFTRFACERVRSTRFSCGVQLYSLNLLSHPQLYCAAPHPSFSRSHSFPRATPSSLALSLAGGQKSLRGTSVGCKPRMKGKGLLTRKEIEALRDQVGRYLEDTPTGALREVRG